MPALSASAPGKVILFGEHAVVYGQPAIAVPVQDVAAKAIVTPDVSGPRGRIHIDASEVGLTADLDELDANSPLSAAVHAALQGIDAPPAFKLRITSSIPVAGGLGSGAAVSVAILRAVSAFIGKPLKDEKVNELAFDIEKIHHGTPSGIDNTVITFAKPIYYIKGQPIETLRVAAPFDLLIADTGISTPTRVTVGDVRAAWEKDPAHYDSIFARIGEIAKAARLAIESGDIPGLGPLMDQNHSLLQELHVSSAELDTLVNAARQAGALGAKLSGGGRGGNMIALVEPTVRDAVAQSLRDAGAMSVIKTTMYGSRGAGELGRRIDGN